MLGTLQIFLVVECTYEAIYNAIFFVFFCRKVLKLDKLGDNLEVRVPRTTWIKFGFVLFIMALMITHIIFAYSASRYWAFGYSNYSLVNLLFIVNYTMQLYIMVREVRKCEGRHFAGLLYWILIALSELVEVVAVENLLPKPSPSLSLQLLILLLNLGLVLITVIFEGVRRGKKASMMEILLSPSIRTAESSVVRKESLVRENLYIEFNEFQFIQGKRETVCEFKIAVYFEDEVQIITKSEADFLQLADQLLRLFPHSQQLALPPFNTHHENMMRYGEERQNFFEQYLVELTKTDEFYCPPLLEFLELPASARMRLGRSEGVGRSESLYSEEEERLRVPFFRVSRHKGSILISNPDILELIVSKPRQEVVEFHDRLVGERRLAMELLPESPSEEDLVHFFEIVVNRKGLWRSFAVWFGLGGQLEEKIHNYFDVWNVGFRNVEMKVVGHEKNFDKEGKIHTLYLLSIQRRHPDAGDHDAVILKKRYSDFFALNKEVHRFLSKHKLKPDRLPEMPPKLSPFGSKTSPKSRVARFDHYMKELTKIEGINHCTKLLEFLEVDSRSCPTDLYESAEMTANLFEHSERSYFSDLSDRINF